MQGSLSKIFEQLDEYKTANQQLAGIHFQRSKFMDNIIQNPYKIGLNEFIKSTRLSAKLTDRIYNYEEPSQKALKCIPDIHKYDNMGPKILKKIKNSETTIKNLSRKEIKFLLGYINFSKEDFGIYMDLLLHINEGSITTSTFLLVLSFYYYYYFEIICQPAAYNIISKIWDTFFSQNKKFWSKMLLNIKEKKELLISNNIVDNVVHDCFNNRLNNNRLNIIELIFAELPNIIIESDLFKKISGKIGQECFNNISNIAYQDILGNDLLQTTLLPRENIDNIVSQIIILFEKDISTNGNKQRVKRIILSNPNYGDPRLSPIQWSNIDNKAKQIFITWLAQDDLEFFFNSIFKDKNDIQGRKSFWINYVNSRELISSRVILSAQDYLYWKSLPDEDIKTRHVGRFVSQYDDASCFILEFKNATIVEFSLENNALYMYKNGTFSINMENSTFNQYALKKTQAPILSKSDFFEYNYAGIFMGIKKNFPSFSKNKTYKVRHTRNKVLHVRTDYKYDWQYIVSSFLNNVGIYPGEE